MFIRKYFNIFNQNQLLKGSLVLFIGSFAGGILNYGFNTLMSRMLGPENYGSFSSLISLTYIIAVPAGTLAVVVAKKVAGFQIKKEIGAEKGFIKYIFKKSALIGLLIFLAFLALSPIVKEFLKINNVWPLVILALDFFIVFISSVPLGSLRGRERFFDLSWVSVLTIIIKIIAAFLLVKAGLSFIGAIASLLVADILIIGILFFRARIKGKIDLINETGSKLASFAIPVFFASLCIAALYNIDVILAKHFLSSTEAGYYAVLSLLGKIIFFGTSAIGVVIFPLTAKNHELGLSNRKILKASIILTLLGSGIITLIYFSFPSIIVSLLFGSSYLAITPYVGLMGVIFIFYSLINLLVSYALSCGKTSIAYILVFGTALEIFLLSTFHSGILAIIYGMMITMGITLGGLAIYLILGKKKNG